jgi:hypothetical protein
VEAQPRQPGDQLLGAAGHVLRGDGLGGLGPHLVGLGHQRAGLLLGVGALPAAAPLVGLPGLQVRLPAQVVDVDHRAGGVEEPDLVDRLQQRASWRSIRPPLVGESAQPGDRVGVEVVGRLVEQQDAAAVLAGVAEQDPGQLDAAALTAGEGADGLARARPGRPRLA